LLSTVAVAMGAAEVAFTGAVAVFMAAGVGDSMGEAEVDHTEDMGRRLLAMAPRAPQRLRHFVLVAVLYRGLGITTQTMVVPAGTSRAGISGLEIPFQRRRPSPTGDGIRFPALA
jgi:hypothetical protein